MINFTTKHIPLITYQTSGDTFFIKNVNDCLFFSVIDIAGHGTRKCFFNAKKLKKIVENKIEFLDFEKIFLEIHKEIIGDGAVVLVGKINTITAEYEYSCVGNISIKKINTKDDIEILKTQEGIVGIYLPSKIKKQKGILKNKEYLLFHTDGIKTNISLSKYFVYNKDLDNILDMIIKRERNIDDALGLLMRYEIE